MTASCRAHTPGSGRHGPPSLVVVVLVATLYDHPSVAVIAVLLNDPAIAMTLHDDRRSVVIDMTMLLDHLSTALVVTRVDPDPAWTDLDRLSQGRAGCER